jgi:hypothetical protein
MYPAALPFVIGVMASDSSNQKAWQSNFGYSLWAPGVGILSTLPGNTY